MSTSKRIIACCAALLFLSASALSAQSEPNAGSTSNYNWKLATLGGTQFWTDSRIVGSWRVQRNTYFDHFRLLDGKEVRHAWGSEEACNTILDQRIKAGVVKPNRGRVVILLHGLLRTSQSMEPMADHLRSAGYDVISFRYASSRETVADHAAALHQIIQGLGSDVSEINFAAHSLGNIVVRHYVADRNRVLTEKVDPRIKRMVMLGPPNQGSRMARLLKSSTMFKLVAGASGAQLAEDWKALKSNLATPDFQFGIIAGGLGDEDYQPSNLLLPGRDDLTVSEQETKLVGARDFLVRPLVHSTMMKQQNVLEATTTFLKRGFFISRNLRSPIESLKSVKQLSTETESDGQ